MTEQALPLWRATVTGKTTRTSWRGRARRVEEDATATFDFRASEELAYARALEIAARGHRLTNITNVKLERV
jgi:hypothetical protein